MKTLNLFFIITLFASVIFADGVEPAGSGIEADPYQIETLDNLLWISTNNDSWDKYYVQTSNIDATETQNWNNGFGFSPIGFDYDNSFLGQYSGQEHIIYNLFTSSIDNDIGLFGYSNGAIISNLGLNNVNISGHNSVGSLVGTSNNSIISNCYSTGIVSGNSGIGGLIGLIDEDSIISDSYSFANVNGNLHSIGGLVGKNYDSIIMNCNSTGNIIGNESVGGLVGSTNYISSIRLSFSTGNVTGVESVGGLVGRNTRSTIQNCYSSGNVNGSSFIGGFVGDCTIQSNIYKCYSNGTVDGADGVGGFVGYIDNSSISNSFWDIETSGMVNSYGGTGKTTLEMKDVATYTDLSTQGLSYPWDFVGNPYDDNNNEDYWDINNQINNGYPFLTMFITGIVEELIQGNPEDSYLKRNYPNPFNPSTTIEFSIQNNSKVVLSIYNTKGQKIKTLTNSEITKGNHSIIWDGVDEFGDIVGSGIYYYKLKVNGKTKAVKKCLLLK